MKSSSFMYQSPCSSFCANLRNVLRDSEDKLDGASLPSRDSFTASETVAMVQEVGRGRRGDQGNGCAWVDEIGKGRSTGAMGEFDESKQTRR